MGKSVGFATLLLLGFSCLEFAQNVRSDSLANPSPALSYYTPFRERQVVLTELSLSLNLVTIPPPVVSYAYASPLFYHPGWRRKKRSLLYSYHYTPVAIQHPPIVTPANFTNTAVISTETILLKENIRDFANFSKVVTDGLHNADKALENEGNTIAMHFQRWTKTYSNGTKLRSGKGVARFPEPESPGTFREIRLSDIENLPAGLPAELIGSLQLLYKTASGLHEKAEANGLRKDGEMRKKAEGLKRPRFHDTTQVEEDPLKEKDAEARKVSWILTNTLAYQTIPKIPTNVQVHFPVVTTVNLLKKK